MRDKSQAVKQKNNINGKRGDRKNSKLPLKAKFDPFSLEVGLTNFSPASGGSNVFGIYGLKPDVHDVSKLMDDIPLDELLDGTYNIPSLRKDKEKKEINLTENILYSVNKACFNIRSLRMQQPKQAEEMIVDCLSEEEIASLKEMFKMIDTDNSGHITYEELKVGLEKAGTNLMESEIYDLMQAGVRKSPGIIPLAVKNVFEIIQETPGREYLLHVSYLEIYNEVINDLLDPAGQNLQIREDTQHLIDLAGSESSKIETNGFRRKEGSYINKSLLTLGTVISKLTDGKATHIPYRDSKLSRLLQSSLSGHGRISLICNVTPASGNSEETHNTLKFAHRSKHVEIKASQNKILDEKSLIKKYQKEILSLKQELQTLKHGISAEDPCMTVSIPEDLVSLKLLLFRLQSSSCSEIILYYSL